MNLRQYLTEMPITNFQLVGKWNKPGQGYTKQDVGILTNTAAVEKIHKKWSNTKENFDFYFVKQPNASKFIEIGEVTPEWVKEKLNLDIQANPSNITIIFTNNRGDERVPMTAWIIAHRLGHAIRLQNFWGNFVNELEKDFSRIDFYNHNHSSYLDYTQKSQGLLALMTAVGTMRSARMGNLRTYAEFSYELLAQMLLTGHIKFNQLPQCIIPDPRKAWGQSIEGHGRKNFRYVITNIMRDEFIDYFYLIAWAIVTAICAIVLLI